MRNTRQKQEILLSVQQLKTHPTADEIYTHLKKTNSKLSLGTVYRNLNKFAHSGKIKKITVANSGDRFDFRRDEHEHFICDSCGGVRDVEFSQSVLDLLAEQSGTQLTGYTLMMYGVCKDCAEQQKSQKEIDEAL